MQENVILHVGNDFLSRHWSDGGAGGYWATFDKGVTRTWMGSFPRDNCPELFQSQGVIPAAAHKNVTPFKARVAG